MSLNSVWDDDNIVGETKGETLAETANWQVTAITIYCDAVDDEVTIMVYNEKLRGISSRSKITL